jgi:hypothetical protein
MAAPSYDHELTAVLTEHEAEIFWLLANGWVAVRTVNR